MKHTTNSYMRVLGNAEQELIFCVNNYIRTLELNIEADEITRQEMGETYAREIRIVCEKYLRGTLPCNKNARSAKRSASGL